MSYLENNNQTGRVILPDVVRAFALFGIVLVNVAYFAYPADITYYAGGLSSPLDNASYFGVNALFLFKSYTLFSFMFGVGLAHQMRSAERRGISFTSSYFRRMFALVFLGILHVTFAFLGDILIFYGVLGIVLFLFRNKSQKVLVRAGIILVIIQVLVALFYAAGLYMAENFTPDDWIEMQTQMQIVRDASTQIYIDGELLQVAKQRWLDWLSMVSVILPLQGPGILGFFLLGLAAMQAGVLSDPKAKLWAKARKYYLGIGVLLSAIGAAIYLTSDNAVSSTALLAYAILLIAAPFSSIGYIGLIAKWTDGPLTSFKVFVARGGTASLTAYLLQSVILSLIFCGYGLGFYQSIGAFGCVVIAILTGVFTVSFASVWRTWFKRGPMESLLRSWTYMGK